MKENFASEPIPPDHQLPAHTGADEHPRKKGKGRLIVWLLMFLVFGALLWWVMHHKADSTAAGPAAGGRRGGLGTGPVVAITATATQGDIGVYQDAIGTVTPVYTDSIISQVTGVVTA